MDAAVVATNSTERCAVAPPPAAVIDAAPALVELIVTVASPLALVTAGGR